ncbi:MAG: YHYH protein [Planctomycetota bacterium]
MTFPTSVHVSAIIVVSVLAGTAPKAIAHPWHRIQEGDRASHEPAHDSTLGGRFIFTSERKPPREPAITITKAFEPFSDLQAISCRSDDRFFYVESTGMPDHQLMVGIRNWQQQVPLPQKYVGDNAWQIPLEPVPAQHPATTKNRFLRGAIALAVNGVPIFNPLNNRGEDAFLIGELDAYGGHCGRADDYHYHIAPVHLEKQVGKGMPIAYALDGYPIYGYTEPDGSAVQGLDKLGGHEDANGNYHYHATKHYPYLNGGFRGEVIERDGQVDPQPRAEPVRPALPPLRGATITGFESPTPTSHQLTYEVGGRKGVMVYEIEADGSVKLTSTDPSGRKTEETYSPGDRRPGGPPRRGGPPNDRPPPPPRPGERRPPREDARQSENSSRPQRLGAADLVVTSPAFGPHESLPKEFTCDGAGVSPPIEWQVGPAGTKSYALVLWHEAPDMLKSYWVVHEIPATVTRLEKNSRGVGTTGLNDKRRRDYDPMCSKGPGLKAYHITIYALSESPQLPADGSTRDQLLAAMKKIALAEGTLTFTYERRQSR